ncbi:MAG: nuclear transport factor 2 family protein [Burkholderiaceae bacterium]
MMNPVMLPAVVAAYLDAEGAVDAEADADANATDVLAHCFAPDAVVRDEGRLHSGLAAIQAWRRAARAKYRYRAEALDASGDAAIIRVRMRLSGAFPGSPVELDYRFQLAGDKIARLEIG